MKYHDSLWKDAPEAATHWACNLAGSIWLRSHGISFESWTGNEFRGSWDGRYFIDIRQRPLAYQSAAQLIAEYRKEHGAEIDEMAKQAYHIPFDDERESDIKDIIRESAFHMALLEKHLAAEREKIESEGHDE